MPTKLLLMIGVLFLTAGCGSREAQSLSKKMQGKWLVISSSGEPARGNVFVENVSKTIFIQNDILQMESLGRQITKKIIFRSDLNHDSIDLEPDKPRWKTWSRIGIVKVEGEFLYLCVNFPNNPRPTQFTEADDGRELVILRRINNDSEHNQ